MVVCNTADSIYQYPSEVVINFVDAPRYGKEKIIKASLDIIDGRAKDAAYNESSILIFPEDAFTCTEDKAEYFIGEVNKIAMANTMNVHSGILYLDVPKEGRQTFYGMTGNWFPWICAVYCVFAVCSGFVFAKKKIQKENTDYENKIHEQNNLSRASFISYYLLVAAVLYSL